MAKAGTREGFLADLLAALANDHGYRARRGHDTDVEITSNPVDGRWGAGPDRAEYSAAVRVAEGERSVYFWETLESRDAVAPQGASDEGAVEAEATVAGMGPGTTSWEWGHGTLRTVVEDVASRHGFLMHPVLARSSATW